MIFLPSTRNFFLWKQISLVHFWIFCAPLPFKSLLSRVVYLELSECFFPRHFLIYQNVENSRDLAGNLAASFNSRRKYQKNNTLRDSVFENPCCVRCISFFSAFFALIIFWNQPFSVAWNGVFKNLYCVHCISFFQLFLS